MNKSKNQTFEKRFGFYCLMIAMAFLVSGIIQGFILSFLGLEMSEEVLSTPFMNVVGLYLTIVSSLIILWIAIKLNNRTFSSLGITKKDVLKRYVLGHVFGFVMLSGALVMTFILGGADYQGFELREPLYLFIIFIGFMFQGFEEELMCRGFMMFGLRKSHSIFFSVISNSLFFATLHLGNPGINLLSFVNLVLAGVVFSSMAIYFDDIWVASGAHSMWNFAQGNIYGIFVSGMDMGPSIFHFKLQGNVIISGGKFGLEGGLGVFVIEIITIIVLYSLYRKKSTDVQCH